MKSDIFNLQNKKDLFNLLIQPDYRGNTLGWREILKNIIFFYDSHPVFHNSNFKKYIFNFKDAQPLFDIGLDINYVDCYGLNLLHYVLICGKKHGNHDNDLVFTGNFLNELIEKTSNINLITKLNENILFHLTEICHNDNLHNKAFFNAVSKYPELDIHLINKRGQSLLNIAIRNGNIDLANYLIEHNVSIYNITDRKYNLLSEFLFLGGHTEQKDLFKKLLLKLDIAQEYDKTDEDRNILETFLRLEMTNDKQWGFNRWIRLILKSIISNDIFVNKTNQPKILKSLKKYKKRYLDIFPDDTLYQQAIITLNKNILENKINKNPIDGSKNHPLTNKI